MYKYISSKSELYRYVVDYSLEKLREHFNRFSYNEPSTIKDFLLAYSEHEFAFYTHHPYYYRIHINVFVKSNEPIDLEIREELKQLPESYFNQLMFSIDRDLDEKMMNIYKWVLDGINKKYYSIMMKQNQEKIKDKYLEELNDYLTILEKTKTEE